MNRKKRLTTICMGIILLLSSVQIYAELLTPHQQNMIKAMIDVEYNRLKKGELPTPYEQTENEIFLLSGKNLSDPQIKEKTFQQVMQFTQLSAQAPITPDRAYDEKDMEVLQSFENLEQIKWFLFSIAMLDPITPEFICQNNNELCRAYMTDTNAFEEVFRTPASIDPPDFKTLVNKICTLEKDCSDVHKNVILNKLNQFVYHLDINKVKASFEQQLKRLNIKFDDLNLNNSN